MVLAVVGCSSPITPVAVQSIVLDPATMSLELRADGTSSYGIVSASVAPSTAIDPSVTWSSSVPTVATVDPTTTSGRGAIVQPASGASPGTTQIVATSNDGTGISSSPITVTVWSIVGTYTCPGYANLTLGPGTAWTDGTNSGTFATISGTVEMMDNTPSGNILYQGTYTQTGLSLSTTDGVNVGTTWAKQ
jgi:uncharacterized protein YjdB